MMTLRPLGPRVTLTASARVLTPFRMAFLPSWSNLMSFAAMLVYPPWIYVGVNGFQRHSKKLQLQGARRAGREAYLRYVERHATERNAAAGRLPRPTIP